VELVDEPQLQTDCEAFLQKIGYRGFAGVEVKRDRRDGKFRLIEINPRFGLWDDLGAYIGADVGMSGYRDLIGEEVAPSRPRVMDYRWASFHRDLRAFFAYRREGLLTLSQWLRSLHGPIVWADPRWDEPRISIVLLGQLARGIGRRLLRAAHGDS
jgi:predicted ATP-grasp superfamily ATP-dependent carboligase